MGSQYCESTKPPPLSSRKEDNSLDQPDFIIIPTQILRDKSLQPADRELFGYIYWLTKLKNSKCTASNDTLAGLCDSSARNIQNGLNRLEKSGWVRRIFAPNNPRARVEIECLVQFMAEARTNSDIPRTNSDIEVRTNSDQNKSINKKSSKKEKVSDDTLAPKGKPEINEAFESWQELTGLPITSQVKANRFAASNLLKKHGADGVRKLIKLVAASQQDRYAPRVADFRGIQAKQNELLVWAKKTMVAQQKNQIISV